MCLALVDVGGPGHVGGSGSCVWHWLTWVVQVTWVVLGDVDLRVFVSDRRQPVIRLTYCRH